MGILSPNELCTAIISLTLPSKITSKAIPKNLKSEISHLFSSKLPIRKIKKELSGEKPFEEVLKSNSFDFPLNLLILKGFKCNRDLFETENSLSSTIIFFSYLSWIVSENSSSEIGELIYDNILLILNCVKSEKSTINIASSIMYYLLLYLVSHSAELPAGAIYKMIDQVMNGSEFIAPKKYFNVVDQSAYQLTKTEKGESEYFQLLTNLVKKYSQDVPVKTLEEAVPIVCRSLSKFELQAIEYISTLSKYLSIDFVLPFISIIPLGFTVKVNETQKFLINYEELNRKEFVCLEESENKLEDEWETNPKNEDPFLYLNNFDEPLDTDFDFDFSINNFPLESFIDENLGQVLKFFINHFSCNAELCSLTALSFLKCKKEFDHSYFYMLCYFYIFEQLKKTAIFDIPFEILTNSNIFNPRITIFDFQMLSKNIDSFNSQSIIGDDFNNINKNENDSNWPLINSLRSKILEIIINSSLIDYQRFLQSLFQYPLLFAETLYRLSKIEMSLSYEKGAMFIDLIFNANSFYSSFYKSKNELIKNINGIRIAKQAIFHFLEHILQNDVNLRMFFSDNEFVIGISSLIFEKSLRPFLLKLFCLYPHSSEFDSLHCDVVNQIKVIFGKVFKHLDKIEYVDETNELLKFINRVIPQNIKTVDIFMTIISPLCLNLFKLPKDNECSVALINNVFELLINCSNSYTLTSSDILALESTISKIIIIDENLVNSLTRIILGRKHEQIDTSMNNLIELKQPGVVRTMINIFYNTPYMNSVLSLINKLCQSSDYNKVKMSTNEIDICLIHLLEKYRDLNNSNDNSNNEIIFDTINILLMEISKHCSSVSVVQSFIQLFCLDNGKTLPNFHEKTLKTFLSLVSCPPENDSIVIPFDNSNEFTINQVKGNIVNNNFTLCFWICMSGNSPFYLPKLCSFTDPKNKSSAFEIILSWDSLNIYFSNQQVEFECNFIQHKWHLITVTFETIVNSELKTPGFLKKIIFTLDQEIISTTCVDNFTFGDSLVINCLFCGTSDESQTPEQPAFVSQFSMYPMIGIEKIQNLVNLGKDQIDNELKPHFAFIPIERVGIIELKNIVNDSPIYSNTTINSLRPVSFADIFCKRIGVDLILPLVVQWDIVGKNNEKMVELPNLTLDILSYSLQRSNEAQKMFFEAGGFDVLSFLLISVNEEHISFEKYSKLYEIFIKVNDRDLKESLFNHILINIDIWMRCTPEDHRFIIEHWTNVLFSQYSDIAFKSCDFQWCITLMRTYYYYSHEEQNICSKIRRVRNCHFQIGEIRQYLLVIALQLSKKSFNINDFNFLINNIVTCRDCRQQIDFINLLNMLLIEENSPLLGIGSLKYIRLLIYLIKEKNKEISILGFKVILIAIQKGFLNDIFENHTLITDIILHQIDSQNISSVLYYKFLDQIVQNGFPQFFQICSWMALNLGHHYMESFYSELTPSSEYVQGKVWCLWPVFSIFVIDHDKLELKKKIISFLVNCSLDSFDDLYTTCDLIATILNVDNDFIKEMFIKEFHSSLISRQKQSEINSSIYALYFKYVRHFLFFRRHIENPSSNLKILFDESPFREFTQRENLDSINSIQNKTDFSSQILKRRLLLPKNSDGSERYSPNLVKKVIFKISPKAIVSTNRRTSMFDARFYNRFCVNNSNSGNDSSELSPNNTFILANDLDTLIMDLDENTLCYHFGLRLDKNMKWVDVDIALDYLRMYENKYNPDELNNILIIASFILLSKPDEALTIASKIEFQKLIGASCLFDLNSLRANTGMNLLKLPENEMRERSYYCLKKFYKKNSAPQSTTKQLNEIKKFQDTCSIMANEIYNSVRFDIYTQMINSVNEFSDKINLKNSKLSRKWHRMWHCFSTDRAPWHKNIPSNLLKEQHFKRDFTMCYAYFAPKFKNNYHFNPHIEASLLRDSGDITTAKSLFEKYKEELKSKYESDSSPLFNDMVSNDYLIDENENIHNNEEINNNSNSNNSTFYVCFELPCEIIKAKQEHVIEATFILSSNCIVISVQDKKKYIIQFEDIKDVYLRTRFHHPSAIEIFLYDGSSFLLNFPNMESIDVLDGIKKFSKRVHKSNFKAIFQKKNVADKWVNNSLTNFEYLMALNFYSGRSFNDLSMYPVFPWVLQDYSSEQLDLTNESIYRDLSKPVGALNEERLKEVMEKEQELTSVGMGNYLYSSCYSCPLIVCLYLIRNEPFTSMHIEIQSGKFDHPARLFKSIAETYKLCTTTHNDYRELIPEFFITPEFLVNADGFDLGEVNDSKTKINNVKLPNWAKSPIDFIYLHRKALESDYVSQHLNEWIDLIWGYKQQGQAARESSNVFLKSMYPNVWDDKQSLNDITARSTIEAVLCHVGQVPPQLFTEPHPKKSIIIQNNNHSANKEKNENALENEKKSDEENKHKNENSNADDQQAIHQICLSTRNQINASIVILPHSKINIVYLNQDFEKIIENFDVNQIMNDVNTLFTPRLSLERSGRKFRKQSRSIEGSSEIEKYFHVNSRYRSRSMSMNAPGLYNSTTTFHINKSFIESNDNDSFNSFSNDEFDEDSSDSLGNSSGNHFTVKNNDFQTKFYDAANIRNSYNNNCLDKSSNNSNDKVNNINLNLNARSGTRRQRRSLKEKKTSLSNISVAQLRNRLHSSVNLNNISIISNDSSSDSETSFISSNRKKINSQPIVSINIPKLPMKHQYTHILSAFNGVETYSIIGENKRTLFQVSSNQDSSTTSNSSINLLKDTLIQQHRCEITSIAADKHLTVISDRDAIISCFSDKKLKFTIPIFSGSVRCCSINSVFQLGVFGTNDNCLLFCSLSSGTVVKTVSLGDNKVPIKILITKKWGFVVVHCSELAVDDGKMKYSLLLYTVNGEYVRSTEIKRPIESWTSFSDQKGFDFIIMANDFMKCYVFEAFYMEINDDDDFVFSTKSPIVAVGYVQKESCAILVTANSHVYFVQKSLRQKY